ncbi:hypothetical protein [Chitinophaga rhizosphaerae]|uniref:hypothetical protein n=1 Tax=Chitinophaga rhizosphaerae TaxID=1864947 RepID=UPI0013E07DF7|nr:hypothetical protein [Chitinophaga rhizosphaerae]
MKYQWGTTGKLIFYNALFAVAGLDAIIVNTAKSNDRLNYPRADFTVGMKSCMQHP